MKPLKKCNNPICSKMIDFTLTYCDKHRVEEGRYYNKTARQATEQKVDIKNFYQSKAWRQTRKHKITEQPLCERCLADGIVKAADIIHHKVEVSEDFSKRLDYENLESICHAHHNKEHGGTKKYY